MAYIMGTQIIIDWDFIPVVLEQSSSRLLELGILVVCGRKGRLEVMELGN
jgi:hypothetical protein